MSDWSARLTAEILTEHGAFVRALARSLVHDEHLADDLAQSAWLAAIEHAPRAVGSLRGWLARVMQNLTRQQHRERQRRVRREQLVATPEALPPTAGSSERDHLLRSVIDAVLELREPYKSAILMRYVEGLPPRTIAKRKSLPVTTVRSQLQRGLADLRSRLDQQHGGERAHWMPGLALIAGIEVAKAGPTVGLLKVSIVAAAIAVTAVTVPMLAPSKRVNEAPLAAVPPPVVTPAVTPARAEIAPAPPSRALRTDVAVVSGHVRDETGRPVAGATVGTQDTRPWISVASDGAGAYRLELPARDGVSIGAEVDGIARSLIYYVEINPGRDAALDFTLALGGSLDGHVLDADDQPVTGATVHVGPRFERQWVTGTDGRQGLATQTDVSTDAQGHFRADRLSDGMAHLLVFANGSPPSLGAATIHRGETTSVTIRLERGASLHGVARSSEGTPIAGVTVRASLLDSELATSTITGNDGSYVMRGSPTGRVTLTAKSDDVTLQAREVVELANRASLRWDPVLTRGLELSGRVVDESDHPLAHLWVEVKMAVAAGQGETRTTDAQGRFALTNWRDLPTSIVVSDMAADRILEPLAWVRDVRPGPDEIVIRVAASARNPARVLGRLLSPSKEPLAGVTVDCYPMELDQYHDQRSDTDERGAFAIEPLTPMRYLVEAVAPSWGFNTIGVFDLKPGEELDLGDIVLPERGHLIAAVHRQQLPTPEDLRFAVMCVRPTNLAWGLDASLGIPGESVLPPGDYVAQVTRRTYQLATTASRSRSDSRSSPVRTR